MLHWIPAWVNPKNIEQMTNSEVKRQDRLQQQIKTDLMEADFDEYTRLRQRSDSFKSLLQKLALMSPPIACRDVPGDGNCGIWTLMCLLDQETKRSQHVDEFGAQRMLEIRNQLCQMWIEVAHDPLWQRFLKDIVVGLQLPTGNADAKDGKDGKAAAAEGAQETEAPSTPKKDGDKEDRWQQLLRRLSPEKITKQKAFVQAAGLVKPKEEAEADFGRSIAPAFKQASAVPAKSEPDDLSKNVKSQNAKVVAMGAKKDAESDDGLQEEAGKIEKAGRPRTKHGGRKRGGFNEAKHRVQFTKDFLNLLEPKFDYSAWQKAHKSRSHVCRDLDDDSHVCGVKGFKNMVLYLSQGKKIMRPETPEDRDDGLHCAICAHMLEHSSFDIMKLQSFVDDCLEKARAEHSGCNEAKNHGVADALDAAGAGGEQEGAVGMLQAGQEAAQDAENIEDLHENQDIKQEELEVNGPKPVHEQQWTSFLAENPGIFQFLPPGSEKKQQPVLCRLCSHSKQKRTVFDVVTRRTLRYMSQHCATDRHKTAVARWGGMNPQRFHYPGAPDNPDPEDLIDLQEGDGLDRRSDRRAPEGPDDPDDGDDGGDGAGSGGRINMEVRRVGFQLAKFPNSRLARLTKEFTWYLDHTKIDSAQHMSRRAKQLQKSCASKNPKPDQDEDDDAEEVLQHRYLYDKTAENHTLFHRSCPGVLNKQGILRASKTWSGDFVCSACMGLATEKSIVKRVCKFHAKCFAADLLKARLHNDCGAEEMYDKELHSPLAKLCKMYVVDLEKIYKKSLLDLQCHVREKFLSIPVMRRHPSYQFMIGANVLPLVDVNIHGVNKGNMKQATILAKCVAEKSMPSLSDIDLKLGCYVASGGLRSHPMVHGILIMLVERLRRADRGVLSFKNLQLSDEERSVVSEAGMLLSVAACNKHLFREFGLLHAKPRVDLHTLLQSSLPDPFLSLSDADILHQNALLVENMLPRRPDMTGRRFCLAFDKTYLLKQVCVLRHRLGKGLVGTAWRLDLGSALHQDTPPEASKKMLDKAVAGCLRALPSEEDGTDATQGALESMSADVGKPVDHANEMLEILLWDPACKLPGRPRFPLLSLPMAYKCSAEEMMYILGIALRDGGKTVKSLVFDNHSSHKFIKLCLLGHHVAKPGVPFFGQLEYEALPNTCLVKFSYAVPKFEGEAIWGLNGPLHVIKNVVGKIRSHKRTLMVGNLFVDAAGCRDYSMPPGAFCGHDPQSDVECAVFLNPFFLVEDENGHSVPWALRGLLVINLIMALLQSSVLHKKLTVAQRVENAMTAHAFLDLATALALEYEVAMGLARGSCWLPPVTVRNLQQLAGFICIMAKTIPDGMAWRPFDMTEAPLEQFFGLLRSQYASCQLTVRDYLAASATTTRQFKQKLSKATGADTHTPPGDSEGQSALSDDAFKEIAERSVKAAARLMKICTGLPVQHLRKIYFAFGGRGGVQDDLADEDDPCA